MHKGGAHLGNLVIFSPLTIISVFSPSPAADPDLFKEQEILREFLDTIDSDDDVSSVYSVC